MKKIYSLFEQYGNVDAGDLSSNQKKEMYSDYSGQLAHALKRVQRMGSAV